MKRRTALLMAVLLAWSGAALAHEAGGHAKVMGTVRSIDDREIVVKATDGQERSIRLDDDTGCSDRQGDSTCSAVKPGDRAVVTTRRKDGTTFADEIRFSPATKEGSGNPETTKPEEGGGHSDDGHRH